MRCSVGIVLAGLVLEITGAGSLRGQAGPDPAQPRPPLLVEASRAERLEAAVRMYLDELIGAIQRADTVALKTLVPDEVVPGAERASADRAGCSTLGAAVERLRPSRAGDAANAVLPLSGLILGAPALVLGGGGDTAARAISRVMERRDGRLRYAPLEILLIETDGRWKVAVVRGILAGACGMGLER